MGRKIPGRKHHGVRDVEKQRQSKLLSLKDKINAPPTNPDDQQIPKSLSHLVELKEKVRSGEISLKRKQKSKTQKLRTVGLPNKKRPNKSNRLRRFREESPQSEQDTSDNDDVDDENILMKQMMEDDETKGGAQKNTQRLTKSQKWQRKLKERKLKKAGLNADDGFKNLRDEVKFGETVHAPPTLTAPRKASSKEAPRPGRKNLLLKSAMMVENTEDGGSSEQKCAINNKKPKGACNKVIDRKAKRKNMSHALRRQLDKQQEEVIEAYKLLKSKKYNRNLGK